MAQISHHPQIYYSIKQIVTNLVDKAKQAYYSAKIQSSTTCKQLFQNFNTILGKSWSSPLPSTFDSDDLLNVFSDYFTEKIRTIRIFFPPPNPTAFPDTAFTGNPLLTFESVTDEFVLKIINSASAKSCELDPIPTTLLYENLDILLTTTGYDNKDCPGQVTYSVRQVKISVACPTGQGVIVFIIYWQYHISIQALDFESLWQFLFCGSAIVISVSFHIIKPTDFSVVACDWLASAIKPIRS